MNPIRIVIIDDNYTFRMLIKEIIGTEEDMQICGEAETLEEARKVISECLPDIALIDISVDEREGGLNFLQEVTALNIPTQCIVLSAHAEFNYADKSIKSGARAYICKDKIVRCLVDAIREIHSGKGFASSQAAC